jgi:hypothetical protein
VVAALNVTVHAAETPVEVLTGEYLPMLLQTAGAISADWAASQLAPDATVAQPGPATLTMATASAQTAGRRTSVRPAGRGVYTSS